MKLKTLEKRAERILRNSKIRTAEEKRIRKEIKKETGQ
jgi:hypothetical protein